MDGLNVRYSQMMAKVTLKTVPDKPGIAAEVFSTLCESGITVELLSSISTARRKGDISFAVPQDDLAPVKPKLEALKKAIGFKSLETDTGVSVVNIHGDGLSQDPATVSRIFKALAGGGINLQMISQSLNCLSFMINRAQLHAALDILKGSFGIES
ncbi:MAG: ACT domain-containing protein [Candidatus Edwardsbacteria bacterium]|nr:ACT domain-containing protein [Candidatus Edwardsbacteria bacterium]